LLEATNLDPAKLIPHDTATADVRVAPAELALHVEPMGAPDGKLARRYRITNTGAATVSDFSVRPEESLQTKALVWPSVDRYALEAGASIDVMIGPVLDERFSGVEGRV